MARDRAAAARVCDHREPPPDQQIEAIDLWQKVMLHLRGRRREVLERRCRGERQTDIALSLGISRQRVEQYERKALAIARKLAGV
jgi:DNA-directed RNA polymerase specialized sigma subunit